MNKFIRSINESFQKKLDEEFIHYKEAWGQTDEDPYEFAIDYNLECKKIRSYGDETIYEFSGHIDDFVRAKKDGYFMSMDESLKESLKTVLSRLDEAPMSDEDRRDSDILRNLYKKIGGQKYFKLEPEEKEVLDKYGLDAWGFRGDTKVISPKGNLVVNDRELGSKDYRGRFHANANADKINFADRARKTDSRDWGRKYANNRYWTSRRPNELERKDQAQEMQKPLDNLKSAKLRYSDAKDALDNYYTNLAHSIEVADNNANVSDERSLSTLKNYRDWEKEDEDAIQKILSKHRKKLESIVESLNEATSPEDKQDSDLLRSVLMKLDKRSNAKLNPEELDVLRRYNLVPSGNGVYHQPSKTNYGMKDAPGRTRPVMNPNYNLAGKLRKPENEYANEVRSMNWWDDDTFQSKERSLQDYEMGKDVSDMRDLLRRRNDWRERANELEAKVEQERIRKAKERDERIAQLTNPQRRKDVENKFIQAKNNLNAVRSKYGLPTREGFLKEGYDKDHMTRVIPTIGDPKINSAIIDSVLGQLSDGIWENSPGMDGYWTTADTDGNGNIIVDDRRRIQGGWSDRPYDNKYATMSDKEVIKYFVNKAKYIAQLCLHDNNQNPYRNFNSDNDNECDYMGGYDYLDHDPTYAEIFEFVNNNK